MVLVDFANTFHDSHVVSVHNPYGTPLPPDCAGMDCLRQTASGSVIPDSPPPCAWFQPVVKPLSAVPPPPSYEEATKPEKKANNTTTNSQPKKPAAKGNSSKKRRGDRRHTDRQSQMPICLDHLKGICESKRWHCKYAHPKLGFGGSSVPEAGGRAAVVAPQEGQPAEEQICEVYLLTGFCKFGDRCRLAHLDTAAVCAAPATTSRMTGTSRVAAETLTDRLRRLSVVLQSLSQSTFDSTLREVFDLLSGDELTIQRALPVVFGNAVRNADSSPLYADLCSSINSWMSTEQSADFRDELLRLSERLLARVSEAMRLKNKAPTQPDDASSSDGTTSPAPSSASSEDSSSTAPAPAQISKSQLSQLNMQRHGNAYFVTHLYLKRLIPAGHLLKSLSSVAPAHQAQLQRIAGLAGGPPARS